MVQESGVIASKQNVRLFRTELCCFLGVHDMTPKLAVCDDMGWEISDIYSCTRELGRKCHLCNVQHITISNISL